MTNGTRDAQLRDSRVIDINRVAKVVKGGRRFSFTALVVIGDGAGRVGLGYGKAKEVPLAIQKGTEEQRRTCSRSLSRVHHRPPDPRASGARAGSCSSPAAPGTGVIAGGAARAILEEAGIHDVLCKSLGSSNHQCGPGHHHRPQELRRPDEVARLRGLDPEEFVPTGLLEAYRRAERGEVSGRGCRRAWMAEARGLPAWVAERRDGRGTQRDSDG